MRLSLTLVCSMLACGTAFAAEPAMLAGRVVDEGGAPLAQATVKADGQTLGVNVRGEFGAVVDDLLQIEINADGYYRFLHTLDRKDVDRRRGRRVDFTLVGREAGRRLLLFAGDCMLARRYFEPRAAEPTLVRAGHVEEDGAAVLAAISPYVALADYASVNLETQLADTRPQERLPKSVTFYSSTALAGLLRDAGFDYVALGNNHTFDYRDEGLRTTMAAIESAGLGHSGAGYDENKAREPHVAVINGSPVAFLSYVGWAGKFKPTQAATPSKGGAALGSGEVFVEDVSSIAADMPVALQHHSGLEYAEDPAMTERTSLRVAIDAGADVAIGHHAHVLQGLELYDDRLIAYSMGNFMFDQYHYTTQLGMLLYVWMDGERFHRAEIVPLHVNGYIPTPATGNVRFAILNRIARLSSAFGTCVVPNGGHGVITAANDGCRTDQVGTGDAGVTQHLGDLGIAATSRVLVNSDRAYRLGVDILRRGDFEYVGRFGSTDRSWIEDEASRVNAHEPRNLRMHIPPGSGPARSGMKVFERVFRPSTPTTLSGRVRIDGHASVQVLLQRRTTDATLEDALADGPIEVIGSVSGSEPGWRAFSLDFDQPRVATRSVRLLFEVEAADGRAATVEFDDLAWVEWHTPWLERGDHPIHATHIQFRR